MTDLLSAVRDVLLPARLQNERPLSLREDQEGNKCRPITVEAGASFVAVRLDSRDWWGVLAELNEKQEQQSVRKLPDYLLFGEPSAWERENRKLRLKVVVCEIKSGSTGAKAAERQLRLGRLLSRYVVGVAALRLHEPEPKEHEVVYSGMIAVPRSKYQQGETDPRQNRNRDMVTDCDPIARMPIHIVPDDGVANIDYLCRKLPRPGGTGA